MHVDVAYCYWLSSMVVGLLSVCHISEPCKNGWTDQDAIWVEDSGWPSKPCIRWGPDPPVGRGNFLGKGCPIVKYRGTLRSSVLKRLWARMGPRNHLRWGPKAVLRNVAMAPILWVSMGYNFSCVIASGTIFEFRSGFSGSSYPMKT